MSFTLPLRRSVKLPLNDFNNGVIASDPGEADADTQASLPRMTSGGLVAHYANRRIAVTHATTPSASNPDAADAVLIGRGTEAHQAVVRSTHANPVDTTTEGNGEPSSRRRARQRPVTLRQRLIAACLVATICFSGFTQSTSAQNRYLVRSGDTLESVAAEFGVDPEAILRSSWLSNPPQLTVGDVIIIPQQGQTPDEAALMAAERVGTSPWAAGVYWVEAGDSIPLIAATLKVDPEALLSLNGLAWSDIIYPGDRLLIPGDGTDVTQAQTSSAETYSAYTWVPTHQQEHGLSCEYASAFIATSAFGNPIPESVFIDAIPVTLNPHYGYRGNIDGTWGEYDDYGIYPEPMVSVLNDYGYVADVFYSMGDTTELIAHLDAGHPVVIWFAMWGDTGRVYDDEGTYTVFAGAHVMTAYAYNSAGVYLSNPGNGSYLFMEWSTFTWMWGTIDGMSMAIYPA